MDTSPIEAHYRNNYNKYVKVMTFRAGTEWDAQDIVHDAYYWALRYYNGFDGTDLDRWFRTILTNALKDYKNAEKGYSSDVSFEEEEVEGLPCNQYSQQVCAEIREIIDTKSVYQQEVLHLYFDNGYSAKDISRISDQNYKAVHKMINRFINELREMYDDSRK